MTIAYLIATYIDPVHLKRLICALDHNACFFVHVDKKVDIKDFKELVNQENVHFIEKRSRVLWGDITQVHYQQNLLEACLSSSYHIERICILSGLDYPIWSNKEIHNFFMKNMNKDFIQGIDMTVQRESVTQKYFVYHPQIFIPFIPDWVNSKIRVALKKLLYLIGVRKKLTFTVGDKTYRLHKGSDWWSCTPDTARYMLDTIKRYPEIMRYFRTSFTPSELVWPTLLFNSPLAKKGILTTTPYESLAALTPLHYIYYHPLIKILTEDDWDTLMQCNKPFCRKTVTGASNRLMDMLDERNK